MQQLEKVYTSEEIKKTVIAEEVHSMVSNCLSLAESAVRTRVARKARRIESDTFGAECPTCRNIIDNPLYMFCPYCGQAVDLT